MSDVSRLGDVLAVRALSEVTQQWFAERGLQANVVLRETESYARRQELALPQWVMEPGVVTPESGEACRAALMALLEDEDPEVRGWVRASVERVSQIQVHVLDPVTLVVGGLVLGGLILAARIKEIGPDGIKFYQGIPKELANVLKAGANFFKVFKLS